jgi:flagellar basal-body rod modification protein FlgD
MTTIQSGNTVDQSLLDAMNGKKKTGSSSIQDVQDRFMSLLVAQMKNQDPLNLDNAAVTSQMAQLSTVTGIEKLNASMNTMSANMTASQTLQAASMIGHGVITPGNSLPLSSGKAVYSLTWIR